MRTILSILFISCFSTPLLAQYFYSHNGRKAKSCYVTGGYGFGNSLWRSKLENSVLYGRDGSPLKSGNLKFNTKTSTRCYDINVLAPVSDIMLGLGLNFEENFMGKLEILNPNPDAGVIIYDQRFRFDKFYAIIEVPFRKEFISGFSLSTQARFGYYGYSGVDRENFFGEEALANTYFAGIGVLASYQIIPQVYVFLHPNFEYKYFNNNANENPSDITHNIFLFSAIGGVRIDVTGR